MNSGDEATQLANAVIGSCARAACASASCATYAVSLALAPNTSFTLFAMLTVAAGSALRAARGDAAARSLAGPEGCLGARLMVLFAAVFASDPVAVLVAFPVAFLVARLVGVLAADLTGDFTGACAAGFAGALVTDFAERFAADFAGVFTADFADDLVATFSGVFADVFAAVFVGTLTAMNASPQFNQLFEGLTATTSISCCDAT